MRLANNEDIEKLSNTRIIQQKDDWNKEYEDKNGLFNNTRIYLEKHLNKDFFAFIEEKDNTIIATCCLQIIEYLPQCNDNGKQGYICNVYTDRKYRKQGIQTKLIKYVIEYAKTNNLCELNLSTNSDIAISIYKKFGFEFDTWAMKKDLK